MTFQHPAVFLLLCCSVVVMSARCTRRWVAEWFLLLSGVFAVLQFRGAIASLEIVLAEMGVHYVALQWMLRMNSRSHRAILHWLWLASALAGFVVIKNYFWVTDLVMDRSLLPKGFQAVGCSFLLFRQVCLSVDVRDGQVESIRPLYYANYCLAFWTFLAGPVQRFEAFVREFARMSDPESVPPNREVLIGLNRVMLGFIKMFVIDRYLERWGTSVSPELKMDRLHVVLAVVAFPLHVYVNFSGYCDIVIGLARSVGFALPENFDHPYLARNSLDFWNRWHITLSEFFRDYLYFPLFVSMSRRLPSLLSMAAATLCSFVVMGAWHGSSVRFVVFGAVHGVGVATATLYQHLLKKVLQREGLRRYQQNRWIRGAAVLCFQGYVVLSFLPFQYEMHELISLGRMFVASGRAG